MSVGRVYDEEEDWEEYNQVWDEFCMVEINLGGTSMGVCGLRSQGVEAPIGRVSA